MIIEQTIEIPASHRLTLDVPQEIPAGRAILTFTPAPADGAPDAEWQRTLAVLKRTHGAWKNHPWTTHMEDVRAMREEWEHRDPWNPDPAKQHRD